MHSSPKTPTPDLFAGYSRPSSSIELSSEQKALENTPLGAGTLQVKRYLKRRNYAAGAVKKKRKMMKQSSIQGGTEQNKDKEGRKNPAPCLSLRKAGDWLFRA
jgi:hypothetical protein